MRQPLRRHSSGWDGARGKNLHLDLRWSAGDPERIGAYAAELAGMTPDLILASSSAYLTALLRTTRTITIAIVFVQCPIQSLRVSFRT
jgi:putative tryptophan/tyrosine transport system substrate-binding protein